MVRPSSLEDVVAFFSFSSGHNIQVANRPRSLRVDLNQKSKGLKSALSRNLEDLDPNPSLLPIDDPWDGNSYCTGSHFPFFMKPFFHRFMQVKNHPYTEHLAYGLGFLDIPLRSKKITLLSEHQLIKKVRYSRPQTGILHHINFLQGGAVLVIGGAITPIKYVFITPYVLPRLFSAIYREAPFDSIYNYSVLSAQVCNSFCERLTLLKGLNEQTHPKLPSIACFPNSEHGHLVFPQCHEAAAGPGPRPLLKITHR